MAICSRSTSSPSFLLRACTLRMDVRPFMSGTSTLTCRQGQGVSMQGTPWAQQCQAVQAGAKGMALKRSSGRCHQGWQQTSAAGTCLHDSAWRQGCSTSKQQDGCTWRSKRPGRSKALSKMSALLVAAMMMMPVLPSKPSISVRSWFRVCSQAHQGECTGAGSRKAFVALENLSW